jgi:uncharacterized protein YbjT (DUF2867 family)
MKSVLIIGARGSLGGKVLDAVLATKKYDVKALIRKGSNASKVEEMGVTVVRGDMMDAPSLEEAFQAIDIVINTANGYGQGHPEVDTEGANNVADAVKKCNVKRYIYCSVLTAEKAPDVEHFYNKFLSEEYCRELCIPFIALRPGGFIDQADDYLGDGLKRGDSFAICPWNKTVEIGMIYTPDLAQYFVDVIDAPEDANGKCIAVGWTRTISYNEVADIVSAKVGRKISVYSVPKLVRSGFIYSCGLFMKGTGEMMQMFNYFDTGSYVNDAADQKKYLGDLPTPEDAIGRYIDSLGLEPTSQ